MQASELETPSFEDSAEWVERSDAVDLSEQAILTPAAEEERDTNGFVEQEGPSSATAPVAGVEVTFSFF